MEIVVWYFLLQNVVTEINQVADSLQTFLKMIIQLSNVSQCLTTVFDYNNNVFCFD